MNDIDFIKKACEYAEGFEIDLTDFSGHIITCPDGTTIGFENLGNMSGTVIPKTWEQAYYPLLLQRAIEHVTTSDDFKWFIQINPYSICLYDVDADADVEIFDCNDPDFPVPASSEEIDKAKRAALEYVFEQEETIE